MGFLKKISLLLFFSVFLYADNLEEVRIALAKEFQNNYPKIIINEIDLKISSLPQDFEQYQFLRIANARFNKAQGFIRAEFKTPQNTQKNIFFRYFVKATLEVLKSQRPINRGDKLSSFYYNIVPMSFDKIPYNALNPESTQNLVARTSIRANTILKENMFSIKALIKKNDPIIGVLNDENVDISINLVALENGNLGDKIRAKNKEGKIMQGIVNAKNRIILQ